MPAARKIDMAGFDPDEVEDFAYYDGPVPKRGIYTAKVSRAESKVSERSGNDMIEVVLELTGAEDKSVKGCPLWHYITFSEKNLDRARKDLFLLGVPRKNLTLEQFAKWLSSNTPTVKVRVANEPYEGEVRAKVRGLMPAGAGNRRVDPLAADDDAGASDDTGDDDTGDDATGDDEPPF